jgi:hypothetical protein
VDNNNIVATVRTRIELSSLRIDRNGSAIVWFGGERILSVLRCGTSRGNEQNADSRRSSRVGSDVQRGCTISEPVPVLRMIGSRPAMMATTVIIFGRTAPRRRPP